MMLWAIYKQTLRSRRMSWIIYSAIGFGLLLMYIPIFPAIQAQQATYDQLLNSMPKALLEAFNIGKSAPTLMGYMVAKHFGFVWDLMIILLMIAYSGGAIAKEIDARTMGLLLSLPVSRLRLYLVRLAAGISGLAIFVIVSELATWPLAKAFGYITSLHDIVRVGLLGFAFGLAILCLSLMVSAAVSEGGKVYAVMGGFLLVMYVLNIVASLQDKAADLKYASLFYYFALGTVIDGGHLDPKALLVYAGISLAAAIIGALIFVRRDASV